MKFKPVYELTFVMNSDAAEALSRSASAHIQTTGQSESLTDRYFEINSSPRDVVSKNGAGKKKIAKASKIGKLPAGQQVRMRQVDGAWETRLQIRKRIKSAPGDLSACIDCSSLRETRLPTKPLDRFDLPTTGQAWSGKWFQKKIVKHKLAPALEVRFDRLAMQMETLDGDIRLTINQNIRFHRLNAGPGWYTTGLFSMQTPECEFELIPDKVLVRMKYSVSLPAIFKALIYEFALLPVRMTVYEMCLENESNSREPSSWGESASVVRPKELLKQPQLQVARFEVPACLFG